MVNLKITKNLVKHFRRRALASKYEVMALLVGTITRKNNLVVGVEVGGLIWPNVVATEDEVYPPTEREIKEIEKGLKGKLVVGTLHSHPGAETSGPSAQDIEVCSRIGVVYGVYEIWEKGGKRRTTYLGWYMGTPPMKVRVV